MFSQALVIFCTNSEMKPSVKNNFERLALFQLRDTYVILRIRFKNIEMYLTFLQFCSWLPGWSWGDHGAGFSQNMLNFLSIGEIISIPFQIWNVELNSFGSWVFGYGWGSWGGGGFLTTLDGKWQSFNIVSSVNQAIWQLYVYWVPFNSCGSSWL